MQEIEKLEKKPYTTPNLTVYGDIEVITTIGGYVNPKDTPGGLLTSAFPS